MIAVTSERTSHDTDTNKRGGGDVPRTTKLKNDTATVAKPVMVAEPTTGAESSAGVDPTTVTEPRTVAER